MNEIVINSRLTYLAEIRRRRSIDRLRDDAAWCALQLDGFACPFPSISLSRCPPVFLSTTAKNAFMMPFDRIAHGTWLGAFFKSHCNCS